MSTQLFEEEAPQANTARNGRGSRTATAEAPPAAPLEAAPAAEEAPAVEVMEKSVAPPPAPAPEPAPVVAAAVPAPLSSVGPRFLPDDRASFTHTFRASGAEGLLIVGLYGDGKPGEILLVPRQASAAARETLGAFADALNVALPYGVPLSPLARGLTALISAGEARSAIEHLCGYLESKFPE